MITIQKSNRRRITLSRNAVMESFIAPENRYGFFKFEGDDLIYQPSNDRGWDQKDAPTYHIIGGKQDFLYWKAIEKTRRNSNFLT